MSVSSERRGTQVMATRIILRHRRPGMRTTCTTTKPVETSGSFSMSARPQISFGFTSSRLQVVEPQAQVELDRQVRPDPMEQLALREAMARQVQLAARVRQVQQEPEQPEQQDRPERTAVMERTEQLALPELPDLLVALLDRLDQQEPTARMELRVRPEREQTDPLARLALKESLGQQAQVEVAVEAHAPQRPSRSPLERTRSTRARFRSL